MTASDFIRQHPGKSAKEIMALAKEKGVKIHHINRIYAVRYHERELVSVLGKKKTAKKKKRLVRKPAAKRRPRVVVRVRASRKQRAMPEFMTAEIEALCSEVVNKVKEQVFAKLDSVRHGIAAAIDGKGD
jgi:MoaA/NifB/PqqE/SkfB family radical SAM enzyme